ncbi:MAG: sigma-70 family RNA polymerase sigma factor [Actinomycetia bacterium]|nr:sigma-70 family RNA polymerase sigma factor [Actinomycetes bacterium]
MTRTTEKGGSTERLVRRAQAGNQQAFAELYRQYCSPLYFFANKQLNSENQAADCVQSTFLYALIHLEELQNPGSFQSWLYRICSSEMSAMFKDQKRTLGDLALEDLSEEQQAACSELRVPDISEDDEPSLTQEQERQQQGNLQICLETLTTLQKDMIILRYYAGFEPSEIADMLEISATAARKRLHDATIALRKAWERTTQRPAPANPTMIRLLRQDAQDAHRQAARSEEPIALNIGALLPALLALHTSPQVSGRAQAFLQAACTGDASALAPVPAASAIPAGGVLLSTTAGKLLCAAASVVAVAGLSYGGWALAAGTDPAPRQAQAIESDVTQRSVEGGVPSSQSAAASQTVTSQPEAESAAPTGSGASSANSQPTITPVGRVAPDAPPTPKEQTQPAPATPAPTLAAPTLTATQPNLIYPLGTTLTPACIIADSNATAYSVAGNPLSITISGLTAINPQTPGTYLLFLHATDSEGYEAPALTLRLTLGKT